MIFWMLPSVLGVIAADKAPNLRRIRAKRKRQSGAGVHKTPKDYRRNDKHKRDLKR